jgi:hypothetical protein
MQSTPVSFGANSYNLSSQAAKAFRNTTEGSLRTADKGLPNFGGFLTFAPKFGQAAQPQNGTTKSWMA